MKRISIKILNSITTSLVLVCTLNVNQIIIMAIPQVKNLEYVLRKSLQQDEIVVGSELSRLTAPGENYGSIMLRILIKLKNSRTETERQLDTVGKLIPDSEATREIFCTRITYKTEFQFYNTIIPKLDEFIRSKGGLAGANFVAPFLGGRINLNGSDVVDEDAIILLKNLKSHGYKSGNKLDCMGIEESKLLLTSLAAFHASSLAYRYEHPEDFDRSFKPHFFSFIPTFIADIAYDGLMRALKTNGFSSENIEAINRLWHRYHKKEKVDDVWGTMIQNDVWTNNVLVKYNDSKPVHAVLVDFQVVEYGLPQSDLIFFLFSSLKAELLEANLDNMIDHYYQSLIGNLKRLHVDVDKLNRDSFDEQIAFAVSNYEYHHVIWMLIPLMNDDFKSVDQANEFSEWKGDHLSKVLLLTRLCLKRNWV